MSYTYLASPYTHVERSVRCERFDAVCRAAAKMMRAGEVVFSPIAHSHPIDLADPLPQTTEFWMAMDLPLLKHANKLKVLCIPGWALSKGVAKEIEAAKEWGIPVEYIDA